MVITKERTRLIFTEYTDSEKRYLENMVASMDNIFMYFDPDNNKIGLPTGIEDTVKKAFPKADFIDRSDTYWPYAKTSNVEHSAKPRNQLQIDVIDFIMKNSEKGQKVGCILGTGTGKGVPVDTKLPAPVPSGYILMDDLKVGDKIFGSDGNPVIVTDIFDRGIEDVYEITFSDGRKALCDEDHLWEVTNPWSSTKKVLSTKEIMSTYKQYDISKSNSNRDPYRYIYRIPLLSSPVQYPHRDVPIHPYIVGALIGNGCLTEQPLAISSGDDFVPNKIAKLAGFDVIYPKGNYTYRFRVPNGDPDNKDRVDLKQFLVDLPELVGKKSHEKFIPAIYLYNDYETRMELLRGLMDTDGSISFSDGRFNVRYTSCSRQLLSDIRELILGLGFIANIGLSDNGVYKYTNGYCASLSIRVPNKFKKELFTHPRKLSVTKGADLKGDSFLQRFTHLIIKNVERVGRKHCKCIKVSAANSLFLTEEFIVTHNTFMASYCAVAFGGRTLIIAPTSSIKKQWADTLVKMFNVPPDKVLLLTNPKQFVNIKADYVVASQASLAVLNKKYDLERIMKDDKFGVKIIDEVQMWFKNIISIDACSNIYNNWYLTGTFGRSGDEENKLYQEMFGDLAIFREKDKKPTIFNRKPGNVYGMKPYIHTTMVWADSRLSDEQVKKVTSSMRYSEREGKWVRFGISVPAYMDLVIPPDGTMTPFLRTILDTVKRAEKQVKYGTTLVLGNTIASAEVVASYLRKIYPDKKIYTYHSKHTAQENAMAKKEADIIVSTVASAGTGFDWKGLAKLVVFAQYKSWILADQISGRLRRRDDDKECYMWDIADSRIRQLKIWANVRANVYRRKCKTFKVIDA